MSTSEQARADAMADAETLEFWVEPTYDAVLAASWMTVWKLEQGWPQPPSMAYRYARRAARAAFRAVPGLRGE